jgi:hypothetical protein
MHNPMRKLPTRVRKDARDMLLSLWSESPRQLAPRSIAASVRNMGACISRTTQRIVIGTRKAEWKKLISAPPRKAERNPILQSSLLCNEEEIGQAQEGNQETEHPKARNVAVAIVILTQIKELGWVA